MTVKRKMMIFAVFLIEVKFSEHTFIVKALIKFAETSQIDRTMYKDTSQSIISKFINLYCPPIFACIVVAIFSLQVWFSQSLSHMC